jgi:hypothetical protein
LDAEVMGGANLADAPGDLTGDDAWTKPFPYSTKVVIPSSTADEVVAAFEKIVRSANLDETDSKVPKARRPVFHRRRIQLSGGVIMEGGFRKDPVRTRQRHALFGGTALAITLLIVVPVQWAFQQAALTFIVAFFGLFFILIAYSLGLTFRSHLIRMTYQAQAPEGTKGEVAWERPTELTVTIEAALSASRRTMSKGDQGPMRVFVGVFAEPALATWPTTIADRLSREIGQVHEIRFDDLPRGLSPG